MDMGFLRRAERPLAERRPAQLDHQLLLAALAAQRAASGPMGRAAPGKAAVQPADDDPLIDLLVGGPGWRTAQSAQRGCFSRVEAGRRVNGA